MIEDQRFTPKNQPPELFAECDHLLNQILPEELNDDHDMITELIEEDSIIFGQELQQAFEYNSKTYIEQTFKIENDDEWGDDESTPITETDLLTKNTKKIIVISNVAGMGKTTVLTSLIKKLKHEPNILCLRLNLNDCSSKLKALEEEMRDDTIDRENVDLVNLFDQTVNTFDELSLKVAVERNEVVTFFDGIDEISSNYDDVIVALIKLLLELSKQIYITTRPNRKMFLKKKFRKLIEIYEMEALQNEVELLTSIWMEK